MKIPESSLKIMADLQKACKSGETSEVDKIPLRDIKMAKAHLSCDSKQPFYVFMLDYIQERENKEGEMGKKMMIEKRDSIFISHISEEAPMVLLLQRLLTTIFKDVPVFVSSDFASIRSGKEWCEEIVKSAQAAKILMVLLSKQSIQEPWINFEAGIGAGAYGEVIPLVGRNIGKGDIPRPLQFRQARDLRNPKEVEALLRDVAHFLNRAEPEGDCSNFTNELGTIMRQLPYQGLLLEPYCVRGEDAKSIIIQFKLMNNGTTDMNLIAVEASVPEDVLLENWLRPGSIPNLSKAEVAQENGMRRFHYTCYSYSGNIPPGNGHPDRLPEWLTNSMSPYDFPTLRFALRSDLADEELAQTIEYKIHARDFVTEIRSMAIRDILKQIGQD